MRPLAVPLLMSIALLTAGCAVPVTDFILSPDSPHQAPHPISYQAATEFVELQGAEVLIQGASWDDQEGYWILSGNFTITGEDGTAHEATQAEIQGSGLSGSAGALVTEARVTIEGLGATLGIGLFGGALDLQGGVSLTGDVSSESYTGQATVSADAVSVEYSDEVKVSFTDSATANMGRGIGVMGADVFAATFHAEDLRIRGERVDGEVTLHIAHAEHFRASPDGEIDIDVEIIQLRMDGQPRLGCRITITEPPATIDVPRGESGASGMEFRIEGPGSAISLRSVAEVSDEYRLTLGDTRPIGTEPPTFPIPGPRPDLVSGITFRADVVVTDHSLSNSNILTFELRSVNCPTEQVTVEARII